MTKKSSHPNPLLTLWYKPGPTLQGLIARGEGRTSALLVAALFGVVMFWPNFFYSESPNPGVLLLGAASAVAGLFLFSWLLRNFGRWFGGTTSLVDVRIALGWGLLPWSTLLIPLLVLLSTTDQDPRRLFPCFFAVMLYGFVILLSAVTVAMRLTIMKAFFCLLFTFLVSIFPLTFMLSFISGHAPPTP